MAKRIGIITLGCRVNQYESSALAERLVSLGFDVCGDDRGCDYYIVNTCAVTAESERKSCQIIRRAAKSGRVAVIGCASQINKTISGEKNVIFVGGCRDKARAIEAIINDDGLLHDCVCSLAGAPYEEMHIDGSELLFSECRGYIKIQDGCNGKCSYCIIPQCRGSVRSRPADDVVAEAKRLVAAGYREIILTGIEVAAYNSVPLHELVKAVCAVPGLERLRLGSLSPGILSERFLQTVAQCPQFMPHLHISIQSLCSSVLHRMCRPYTKEFVFERIAAAREYIPGCMISADIIAGFPGETEEDFLETLRGVEELSIFHVHSFPYSERPGTPAAAMDGGIPPAVRSERNSRLIQASDAVKDRILSGMIGSNVKVLVEKVVSGTAYGHTEGYAEAKFESAAASVGDIVTVEALSAEHGILVCKAEKGE